MPSFFAKKVILPFDDSMRLVEAADFDRRVHFTHMPHAVIFAFTEFEITSGGSGEWTQINPADTSDRYSFALPAGQELWAGHSENGQTVTLGFLVTGR